MHEFLSAGPEADYARAIQAHRAGRIADAERHYRQVLATRPDHSLAWRHLGALLCQNGRYAEGAASLREHVAFSPESAAGHADLGRALRCLGRLGEAVAEYRVAARLGPEDPSHWRELATTLVAAGRLAEAITALDQAMSQVGDASLWLMLGGLQQAAGRLDRAHAAYSHALALPESDPTRARCAPELLFRRAALAVQTGQFEAGRADVAQLLSLSPAYPYAAGLELYLALMICDWNDLDEKVSRGLEAVRAGRAALPPWTVIAAADAPEEQRLAARTWVRTTCGKSGQPFASRVGHGHSRVRLAYLSADFGDHPVAHALAPVIERHSRSELEVIGVSIAPRPPDPMLSRLTAGLDEFIDVSGMTDREAAVQIREREVDILVDLTGYTARSRPNILAARPAPLQVNFLGFPGTLGAGFIDLIIADRVVIPEESQSLYDERVAYLPGCLLPPAEVARVPGAVPTREQLQLPLDALVLAAFHTAYKLTPIVFTTWLRILSRVPGAVLWMGGVRSAVRQRLQARATAAGIDPARLIFAPRVDPIEAHLARLAAADLYLDTLPYNAHTSAADALSANVPVLTCAGKSFAARVGASLLTELGLPDLITTSLREYEERAVELALDGALRQAIRARIARTNAGRGRSIESYCRALEAVLLEAHRRAVSG